MSERLSAKDVERKVAYLKEITGGMEVDFFNIRGVYCVSGAGRAFEFSSPNLRDVYNYLNGAIDLAQVMT